MIAFLAYILGRSWLRSFERDLHAKKQNQEVDWSYREGFLHTRSHTTRWLKHRSLLHLGWAKNEKGKKGKIIWHAQKSFVFRDYIKNLIPFLKNRMTLNNNINCAVCISYCKKSYAIFKIKKGRTCQHVRSFVLVKIDTRNRGSLVIELFNLNYLFMLENRRMKIYHVTLAIFHQSISTLIIPLTDSWG